MRPGCPEKQETHRRRSASAPGSRSFAGTRAWLWWIATTCSTRPGWRQRAQLSGPPRSPDAPCGSWTSTAGICAWSCSCRRGPHPRDPAPPQSLRALQQRVSLRRARPMPARPGRGGSRGLVPRYPGLALRCGPGLRPSGAHGLSSARANMAQIRALSRPTGYGRTRCPSAALRDLQGIARILCRAWSSALLEQVATDIEAFYQDVVMDPGRLEYLCALNALAPSPLWWSHVAHPSLKYLWTTKKEPA